MPVDERPTVYSTDSNFEKRCPRCGSYPCRCRKPVSLPPEMQTVAISRDRKGRKGKTVIVIRDLQLTTQDMQSLTRTLKQTCNSNDTVKDDAIKIQDNHQERIAARLRALGYKIKFVGG